MFHFILIVGFMLLPKAATLKCYECLGTSGNEEKQCPASSSRCEDFSWNWGSSNDHNPFLVDKSCSEPGRCIEGSANFGTKKITAKCCSTDLCNGQSAPEPTQSNGKKCYTCKEGEESCKETLDCKGNEDHCSSGLVTDGGKKERVKGCASQQICANKNNKQITDKIENLSCCQGDYCNSASSTSAGLLLLVAPLIPLMILS